MMTDLLKNHSTAYHQARSISAAALLFMYGLKRMSSPVTAPSGIKSPG